MKTLSHHTTRAEAREACDRRVTGQRVRFVGVFAIGSFGLYPRPMCTADGTIRPSDDRMMRVWVVVQE